MAASPVGAITVDQLLRSQAFINGVRSRIGATGNVFQKFYGLGIDGGQGQPPSPPGHSAVVWEYFDNTRTMAQIRPEMAGPSRPIAKPVGTASGAFMRFYEALMFEDNRIAGFRPPGKPIGTINKHGEDYVARQLKNMLQRQMNSREFCASRLFRGGWDIKTLGGDQQILVEAGNGTISIDTQMPASHKSRIALGAADANIIDASWATASTDIISQFMTLRQVAERRSGLPIKHSWITSVIFANLINNDKFRAAGGSAFRVWEDLQMQKMQTLDGIREQGEEVKFRALPQITFHVYDGVLNVDQNRDSIVTADNSLFIPNDKTILTPEPGDWCGQAVGQEIFTKNYGGQPETMTGSANWSRRVIEPTSGVDLHVWNKYLPIMYVPNATYYATVTGF